MVYTTISGLLVVSVVLVGILWLCDIVPTGGEVLLSGRGLLYSSRWCRGTPAGWKEERGIWVFLKNFGILNILSRCLARKKNNLGNPDIPDIVA